MSSSTPSRRQPKKPNLRERAAALRADLETSRQQPTSLDGQGDPAEVQALTDAVPAPAGTHPEAYALRVDADGLGLHAAPGAAVIVEPVMPEKAGLAVFYLKGSATPVIFDLTHNFRPEDVGPVAPGSGVVPMVEVCEPRSGIARLLDSARIERLHRIVGISTPAEIAAKHRRSPDPLPLMGECPEGMGELYADDTSAYPLARPGETVVYDPAQREPTHGALCVLECNNGRRSLLLTNLRQVEGKGDPHWWVDPVNRPPNREALERQMAERLPGDMLHTSDGPFTVEHLRSKIVGTVVGVLVPPRLGQSPHGRRSLLLEEPPAADPVQGRDASEPGMATAVDEGDTDLVALGRQFIPAAARDLEACRVANEADKDGDAPAEVEAEFVAAAEAAQALAYRIAELPAHTAAGFRAKLRALAHYTVGFLRTRLPAHPDPDQVLSYSLAQDLRRMEVEDAEGVATIEQMAAIPFDAIEIAPPLRSPREWAEAFASQALGMHVADKTLRMDKAALVAFIRSAEERKDACDEAMFQAISCAQETLEGYARLLDLASTRYLAAASALVVENAAKADDGEL